MTAAVLYLVVMLLGVGAGLAGRRYGRIAEELPILLQAWETAETAGRIAGLRGAEKLTAARASFEAGIQMLDRGQVMTSRTRDRLFNALSAAAPHAAAGGRPAIKLAETPDTP